MAVITISRQYGSGGDDIADQVCRILGYRHFTKRHIAQAALESGLSEHEIASYSEYSEVTYKYATFLDRLFHRASPPAIERHPKADTLRMLRAEEKVFNEASALKLVQQAIKKACEIGNVVIIGRAGQVILKDCPGTLHIRIEAPLEERVQRIEALLKSERGSYDTDFEIRLDARGLIAERDASSANYVSHFYGADWSDPSLYHAIFNTGKISLEETAQIIVAMTQVLFPAPAAKHSLVKAP